MKRNTLFTILLLISVNIFSEPLIINQNKAIELTLQNSLSLKKQKLTQLNAELDKKTSYNAFYPKLTGTTGFSHNNTTQTTDIGTMTFDIPPTNFILGFETSLMFSPAIIDGIKLLNSNVELEEINTSKKEIELVRDIKKSFYTLILLEEQIKVLQYNHDELEKRYKQLQENYKMGYVDELQLLEVQVGLENFKPQLNNLKQLYDISIKSFKNSLGVKSDIILDGTIEITENSISGDTDLENSIDVALLDKSLEFIDIQIDLKKHSFYPALVLSYSMSTALNDPFETDNWDSDNFLDDMGTFSAMLAMSFDSLLPNSKTRTEIKKLENSKKIAAIGREELLDGLDLMLTQKIQVLDNSLELQDSLQSTINLAKRRVDLTILAYNQGSKELLEVESAENELRKAQLELLSEKYNYLAATFDIEYMIGQGQGKGE
ncbi:MAG: TolC family protein [Spirochaetaceae bacterium]